MNLVKQIREKKKLSKYRLAELSGITCSQIFRIEHGADVRLSSLERLAKAMNVSVKDLVE